MKKIIYNKFSKWLLVVITYILLPINSGHTWCLKKIEIPKTTFDVCFTKFKMSITNYRMCLTGYKIPKKHCKICLSGQTFYLTICKIKASKCKTPAKERTITLLCNVINLFNRLLGCCLAKKFQNIMKTDRFFLKNTKNANYE